MDLFLIGVHFVVTTIATVGFGDILPVNIEEYIIVMIFQVYIFPLNNKLNIVVSRHSDVRST